MSKKYVQYTITVTVSAEELLEDVVYPDDEEWTEEEIRNYIMEERWDFLGDTASPSDWDVYVRILERD